MEIVELIVGKKVLDNLGKGVYNILVGYEGKILTLLTCPLPRGAASQEQIGDRYNGMGRL